MIGIRGESLAYVAQELSILCATLSPTEHDCVDLASRCLALRCVVRHGHFEKLTKQVSKGECMHHTGWDAAVEDADSFVYVGIVQRYRKLPAGRDKGKVLWTVKYEMEDEGSNSEELDMRELADALARAYAEGKGGPHRAG